MLAVRYRYDPDKRTRIKTVELIEEEFSWTEPLPAGVNCSKPVLARVAYQEIELWNSVKEGGGQWDKTCKLWTQPVSQAQALGLQQRIV